MSKAGFFFRLIGICAEGVLIKIFVSRLFRPTERERTERLIKMRLREIMMQKDLENVTCKEVRQKTYMGWNLHFGFANTGSGLPCRYSNYLHCAIVCIGLPLLLHLNISVQREVDLRSDLFHHRFNIESGVMVLP